MNNQNILFIGGALLLGFMFFKDDKSDSDSNESDKQDKIEVMDTEDNIEEAIMAELESIELEPCNCQT